MDFLGCHVNNTPLTISSKKYPKGISIFHEIYDQTLFLPMGLFLLPSCPVCHLWTVKIPSLVASQSVMSMIPLNQQIFKFIFQSSRDYPFAVMSSSQPLKGRALSLAISNQLCPYYFWTDECLDLSPLWYSNCQVEFNTSEQISP